MASENSSKADGKLTKVTAASMSAGTAQRTRVT